MTRSWVKKPLTVILAIIVLGIGIDQLTKALALANLTTGNPIPILSDIFQLHLLRNPGASFSMGTSMTVVFSVLALVALIAISIFVIPKVDSMVWAVAVGLGMAGIAGNFIDRIIQPPGPFQGYVTDFFALKYFAVFNVADVLLTSAAVLIVVVTLFLKIDLRGHRQTRGTTETE